MPLWTFLALSVGLLSGTALAATPPAEQILPDTTKALAGVLDAADAELRWDKTELGKLSALDIMQPFVDDVRKNLRKRSDEDGLGLGLTWDDLKNASGGEVAWAMVHPPGKTPSRVLLVDGTGKKLEVIATLAKVATKLAAEGAKLSTEKAGEQTLNVFKIGDELRLVYFHDMDKELVCAVDNSIEVAAAIAARLAKPDAAGCLNKLPAFAQVKARLDADPVKLPVQFRFWQDPFGFERARRVLKPEAAKDRDDPLIVAEKTGFEVVEGVGGYATISEGPHDLLFRVAAYQFDPYFKWLGISPLAQPVDHYTLLGVKSLETDAGKIKAALEARLTSLTPELIGHRQAAAAKLTAHLKLAAETLTDPARAFYRRKHYERELKKSPMAVSTQYHGSAPAISFLNGKGLTAADQPWVPTDVALQGTFYLDVVNVFHNLGPLFNERAQARRQVWWPTIESYHLDPRGPRVDIRNEIVERLVTTVDGQRQGRVTTLGDSYLPEAPPGEEPLIEERQFTAVQIFPTAKDGNLAMAEAGVKKAVHKMLKDDETASLVKVEGLGDLQVWQLEQVERGGDKEDLPEVMVEVPGGPKVAPPPPPRRSEPAALCVAHGHVFYATHVSLMLKVLNHAAAPKDALAADADYKAVMALIDKEAADRKWEGEAFRRFARFDQEIMPLYLLAQVGKLRKSPNLVARLLTSDAAITPTSDDPGVDFSLLPKFDDVKKYFFRAGMVVRSETDDKDPTAWSGWFIVSFVEKKPE